MNKNLRFHWSMSSAGENLRGARSRADQQGIPNLEAYLTFCRQAERYQMESVLTAIGFHRPDPIVMATALGMRTETVKFMVAVRSGIFSPTVFVQQVNSVSALIGGRICLNVVGGHTPQEQRGYGDFLDHNDRYARTDEFLTVCRALWANQGPVDFQGEFYKLEGAKLNTPFVGAAGQPEIYLGGASPQAIALAKRHASCLWTLPREPRQLAETFGELMADGTELGLLVSILARETHEEAVSDAYAMIAGIGAQARQNHQDFAKRSDSQVFTSTLGLAEQQTSDWLTPWLWTGAVPYLGAPAIALVGSYDEVAAGIMAFKACGVSQLLFMGWPDLEEMARFHVHVEPLVRRAEDQAAVSESATLDAALELRA